MNYHMDSIFIFKKTGFVEIVFHRKICKYGEKYIIETYSEESEHNDKALDIARSLIPTGPIERIATFDRPRAAEITKAENEAVNIECDHYAMENFVPPPLVINYGEDCM